MATLSPVSERSSSNGTSGSASLEPKTLRIALAGNPNAGKTTLFNALTGLRQKVGNYPGVTVEKKEGRCQLPNGNEAIVLDLPGTYSLAPKSPDEEIARDILLGLRTDTPTPDAVIVVVDASNLERNLYLATQVLELGYPSIVALNMNDVALANGKPIDAVALQKALGVPVVPLVAVRGEGLDTLRQRLTEAVPPAQNLPIKFPEHISEALQRVEQTLPQSSSKSAIALRLAASPASSEAVLRCYGEATQSTLDALRDDAKLSPVAISVAEAQARYGLLGPLVKGVVQHQTNETSRSFSDKMDAILTHKVWGLGIFCLITLLVFQAIYSWASAPMDFIEGAIAALGQSVASVMPDGPLQDLLVQGVIAGVGAVLVFLPQILILFFFIGILEDTGYMARAAFLMDRLMARVGLHGRAFIPLLSSFACAIPGIMATRTIASRRDRMTTILIAPLMACSARLPVYTLMIATFIPNQMLWGFLSLRAATMFSLYVLGVVAAMMMAWLFKKTLFKGPPPPLMLELPPYKAPAWRNIIVTMWERGSQFLKRAGTVILAISVVLWFLLNYPAPPSNTNAQNARTGVSPAYGVQPGPGNAPDIVNEPNAGDAKKAAPADTQPSEEEKMGERLRYSFAGRIGHTIEPLIAPLGFNWKIGIGLIGAMSAREVFVSTMGTVYSVGEADETSTPLREQLKNDKWPDGRPVWTTLTAISLLVYFVLAMQCMATLAVVKRETNGWKWPIFMQVYLTALAWIAAFIVYQGGRMLGW
jgi:ferrous iron transport protein B